RPLLPRRPQLRLGKRGRGRRPCRVSIGQCVDALELLPGKRRVVLCRRREGEGMNLQPSGTAHILLDERGRGWIDDTNVKVIEVVLDKLGYGLSPEEIHSEHSHLSLAQIHAAFCWYYD